MHTNEGSGCRVVVVDDAGYNHTEESCKLHETPIEKWFWSETAQASVCPKCITAGYYVDEIAAEYQRYMDKNREDIE